MRNILFLILNLLTFVLSGCGDKLNRNGPAITNNPAHNRSVIRISARDKGNVTSIQFNVRLPAQTQKSLIDYRGAATITGSIHANAIPCLSSAHHFNCPVELTGVGNIRVHSCRIGQYSFNMMIALKRGQHLRETYSVDSITLNPLDLSCYRGNYPYGRGTRGYPGTGYPPRPVYR